MIIAMFRRSYYVYYTNRYARIISLSQQCKPINSVLLLSQYRKMEAKEVKQLTWLASSRAGS